ncbi:MAG: Asp23/Gls24 family envelope stress response protein [Candidatus Omnitrophota bacterium]
MMNREETRTDLGTIRIHKNVIASIGALAAIEIEGVKRVGGNLKSGLLEIFGQKNLLAIGVEINKNEEVKVDIPLVIKYGYNIPDISAKVQENVRNSLEKMTNLMIKDINVSVQGIERG